MRELIKRIAGLKEQARLTEVFSQKTTTATSGSHRVHE